VLFICVDISIDTAIAISQCLKSSETTIVITRKSLYFY
jgi:hypothetical protein